MKYICGQNVLELLALDWPLWTTTTLSWDWDRSLAKLVLKVIGLNLRCA